MSSTIRSRSPRPRDPLMPRFLGSLISRSLLIMTLTRKPLIIVTALAAVVILGGGVGFGRLLFRSTTQPPPPAVVIVKHVVNGHYVRLDDQSELIYAGMRAPYSGEPLFEEARRRRSEERRVGKECRS